MNEVIKYDGPLTIATGASRQSTRWKNQPILWSELTERLRVATRTHETLLEYRDMPKAQKDDTKDVGGFVGGVLDSPRRIAAAVKSRQLITLDMDNLTAMDDPWSVFELTFGCAAAVYGTHSYTAKAPRIRIIIPLSRPVTIDEYEAIARRVAGDLGIDYCDDTTFEPSRLMYWPSVSIDADYYFHISDGPWLDADEQLARYTDWKDTSEWPVSSRKAGMIQRLAKKQGDPTEKSGVIGAFCRVYSIDAAIEEFLPETYIKVADDRYTFAGGSTTGGLVLYDNGKFAYSHHGTDPACGKLCNAFDLVRIHLFGDQDVSVVPGTPGSKYPSYIAMQSFALEDEAVKHELAVCKAKELSDEWDDIEEDEAFAWLSTLDVNRGGNFEATINNVVIILQNDPKLKDAYWYDEFAEKPKIQKDLPWVRLEDRRSDAWDDTDDAGLRGYIEKTYRISSVLKVYDAVEIVMLQKKRHPVKEYLESLVWDGIDRAAGFFIDCLGAEDTAYTRTVTEKALVGAVARIYKPGCKHDQVLVLVGPQGCGKSSTLAALGKDWFSDSLYTVSGKEAYEQIQGKWIIEMGEMAAAKKAELEQIKQFMSKQTDSFRPAYGRKIKDFRRQCAFFGTTNDIEFLRDNTGNRRFWPVDVTGLGIEKITEEYIDQVWAEAVAFYKEGRTWHLTRAQEKAAILEQEKHTEMNGKQGLIEEFLERLVPENWDSMDIDQRLEFLGTDFGVTAGTIKRNKICAIEIWRELFRGDPKTYTYSQAREISHILKSLKGWKAIGRARIGPYGMQRAYERISE